MDYESKMAAMKSLMSQMDEEEDKKFRPKKDPNEDGGIGGDGYNDDMAVKSIKEPDEDDDNGGESLSGMMKMFSSFIGK